MTHECPADGCEYESDSVKGVTTHLSLSAKHEDDDAQYPTDEMLLTEIQRLADELGRTPTSIDIREEGKYSIPTYISRFGSWNNTLQETGLDVNEKWNISKDDLLDELQRLAEEMGRTPKIEEMIKNGKWSKKAYRNKFGSWNNALEEAGLDVNEKRNISKDDLLDELQRLANKLGETPTKKEMNERGTYSTQPYRNKFGSWNNALHEAGLEINYINNISEEILIEEIRRVAEKLDRTPTREEMRELGEYSTSAYWNNFGSWSEAVEEAGLKRKERGNIISNEDLLSELVSLYKNQGEPPTVRNMAKFGKYSRPTYVERFGSWNNALEKAGLKVNKEIDISKDDLLEELQRLADELGKTPTTKNMDNKGKYSHAPYHNKFGSWNNALDEAGLEVTHPQWGDADSSFGDTPEGYAWRKAVYQRDSYTCQDCGLTNTELHAHHINRRADNPDLETMVWNGVTLCHACHAERHADEHVYSLLASKVPESAFAERETRLTELGNPYFLDYWDDVPFAREPSNEPILPNFTNL